VAAELDIPISTRKDFGAADFQLLTKYLTEQSVVGSYQIQHVAELNSNESIIFTKVSFVDFGAGMSGKGGDVNKTEYLTFLTAYNTESRSLTVRSELYYNANDKILKEGFLKAVFEGTAVVQS
jgi:hypothetical protein